MYPFLVDIRGVLTISSRDAFVAIAVVVCLFLAPYWASRLEGIDRRTCLRIVLGLAVAVLVGGRLHFALNHWNLFSEHPLRLLGLWSGGFHAGGAVLALCLALPWIARRCGVAPGALADSLVPTVGVGIALARAGCFLFGCCFGTTCTLPWCVSYPERSYVFDLHYDLGLVDAASTHSAAVHPLPLYFALVGLLTTAAALRWYHLRSYRGQVALVALLIFAITSAALEFIRAEYEGRPYWFGLPQLVWAAGALAIIAVSGLALASKQTDAVSNSAVSPPPS